MVLDIPSHFFDIIFIDKNELGVARVCSVILNPVPSRVVWILISATDGNMRGGGAHKLLKKCEAGGGIKRL
jgi:hypothetical protein